MSKRIKLSEQHKINISLAMKGRHSKTEFKKGLIPWNKGKEGKRGKFSAHWKDGISGDKEYWNKRRRERYRNDKEYRIKRLGHNHKRKSGGILLIQTIQQVYETNIKKYNTLTCYLCLKPIIFKNDCLEHKIPLSRGGNNNYDNLAIAHRSCNNKKRNKTEKEYREVMLI